ncbi:MAG: hypothetical protein A2Y78_00265 [Acidobacteria bacterium RBG_13_68_16]|nr:MAG: hypothetical protein A2Y78_00265 [Acidobacteria bacterium RBG_13_68_16]
MNAIQDLRRAMRRTESALAELERPYSFPRDCCPQRQAMWLRVLARKVGDSDLLDWIDSEFDRRCLDLLESSGGLYPEAPATGAAGT